MNAAFLLVTTAWLAGDTTAAAPCCGATCGTSCDTCCSGPKLLDRLRAHFHHNNCCDTCAAPKCPAPCPAPKCAPVCAPKCAPAKCDSCCESKPKLLDRLRAAFHHDKGCCDGGCSTCATGCCGSGPVAAPRGGETIPTPPQKMPAGGAPPAKTSINPPPATFGQGAPATIQNAPGAGQAPAAIAPNVESENLRSPF